MKSETALMRRIQIAASKLGCRLFRNNVGVGWTFDKKRKIRFGLCKGSSDLIGWASCGCFMAVEVKYATHPRPEQVAFIQTVRHAKGIGIFAYDIRVLKYMLDLHTHK